MTTEIQLSRGLVALIDDDDLDLVRDHSWHAAIRGRSTYAVRTIHLGHGTFVTVRMHRVILGLTPEDHLTTVDHIDGNGLDNRRANLRSATGYQNRCNRRPNQNSRTGLKGVCPWTKDRFLAHIRVNGKRIHLGLFDDATDAAKAYDRAALAAFGEFARPNFDGAAE